LYNIGVRLSEVKIASYLRIKICLFIRKLRSLGPNSARKFYQTSGLNLNMRARKVRLDLQLRPVYWIHFCFKKFWNA